MTENVSPPETIHEGKPLGQTLDLYTLQKQINHRVVTLVADKLMRHAVVM